MPYVPQSTVGGLESWMCLVLAVLRVLMAQTKEEVVLSRIHELGLQLQVRTVTHTRARPSAAGTHCHAYMSSAFSCRYALSRIHELGLQLQVCTVTHT